MKEQLVQLLIEIGLFFANCDGDYDPCEKKFIANFLRSLEMNHIFEAEMYDKEALENVKVDGIDEIISNMNGFVAELNEDEKKPFVEMVDSYIQGIIKADNIIDPHETYYYNMWKENVKP